MKLTIDKIQKCAELSALKISKEEADVLSEEFEGVLNIISEVQIGSNKFKEDISSDVVENMDHILYADHKGINQLDYDMSIMNSSLYKENNYIAVPRIIGE